MVMITKFTLSQRVTPYSVANMYYISFKAIPWNDFAFLCVVTLLAKQSRY
jgi:hypothetical protein